MKWTAFLRLKGETSGKTRKDMPAEFIGLVEFLQNIDVEYDLFITVESEGSRAVQPLTREQYWDAWAHGKEEGF